MESSHDVLKGECKSMRYTKYKKGTVELSEHRGNAVFERVFLPHSQEEHGRV